jgi:Na+/phosphate symporter
MQKEVRKFLKRHKELDEANEDEKEQLEKEKKAIENFKKKIDKYSIVVKKTGCRYDDGENNGLKFIYAITYVL